MNDEAPGDPDDTNDREQADPVFGFGLLILGVLHLTFTASVAVAHYIYGVPIYRRHSSSLGDPALIQKLLITFGIFGIAALGGGLYLRRRR
ncbi:MAG TPA: hypothetical protein VL405_05415 [Sphingomonas sp.]|jgi:hypothetical protein|nr:hypothetical protein [Sphingomonas sp.]